MASSQDEAVPLLADTSSRLVDFHRLTAVAAD
jgi:hypothetical protein